MHGALRNIIKFLVSKKYIGGRHVPEQWVVLSRTRSLHPQERKQCLKEYLAFREAYCIVLMKKTGKGSDWHISLNSHRMKEIHALLDDGTME